MRIDHVIYATADLDAGARRIEQQLGLAAVAGGRHDGIGTAVLHLARPRRRDPGEGAGLPGIAWIEVAGDPARLRTWLGGAELPVRVVERAPAVLAVAVGERELRGR